MGDEAGAGGGDGGGGGGADQLAALQKQAQELQAQLTARNAEINLANQAVQTLMQQNEMTRKEAEAAIAKAQERSERPQELDPLTGQPVKKKKNKLKKMVSKLSESLGMELDQARNQIDQMNYDGRAAGLPEELRQTADATFANWMNKGVRIDGRKPTRADALMFAAGKVHLDSLKQAKLKAADDEANAGEPDEPIIELPTTRQKVRASQADPEAMDRGQRLKTLWPARLDGPGGF